MTVCTRRRSVALIKLLVHLNVVLIAPRVPVKMLGSVVSGLPVQTNASVLSGTRTALCTATKTRSISLTRSTANSWCRKVHAKTGKTAQESSIVRGKARIASQIRGTTATFRGPVLMTEHMTAFALISILNLLMGIMPETANARIWVLAALA